MHYLHGTKIFVFVDGITQYYCVAYLNKLQLQGCWVTDKENWWSDCQTSSSLRLSFNCYAATQISVCILHGKLFREKASSDVRFFML